MEKSRTCEIRNVNVHRASYANFLRGKKHIKKIKQDEKYIPEWFSKEEQAPIEKKIKKF